MPLLVGRVVIYYGGGGFSIGIIAAGNTYDLQADMGTADLIVCGLPNKNVDGMMCCYCVVGRDYVYGGSECLLLFVHMQPHPIFIALFLHQF